MTISPKTLSHIESSVETFPLSHPSVVNNQRRVLLYLDEAGQLKKLPPNPRASGIAAMCGFENVPFAGDMFIGRVVVGPKVRGEVGDRVGVGIGVGVVVGIGIGVGFLSLILSSHPSY